MIIKDIYEHYAVPLPLQYHMIRVAAVAKMISDNRIGEIIDKELIIQIALLHDMGNIVKMDFSLHNEWYWNTKERREEKKQYIMTTYWISAHEATIAICKELWVKQECIDGVDLIWVESFISNKEVGYAIQIVRQADMSVDPWWIVPIWSRLVDAQKRYPTRFWAQEPTFSQIYAQAHLCEQSLFWKTTIQPSDINNETTYDIQSDLWKYELRNLWIIPKRMDWWYSIY
jgi:hypothetical protein